jgi:hypothetical protein
MNQAYFCWSWNSESHVPYFSGSHFNVCLLRRRQYLSSDNWVKNIQSEVLASYPFNANARYRITFQIPMNSALLHFPSRMRDLKWKEKKPLSLRLVSRFTIHDLNLLLLSLHYITSNTTNSQVILFYEMSENPKILLCVHVYLSVSGGIESRPVASCSFFTH